ncbi:ParB/RepB/Spo0J family partition protein [Butyricicoccus pullicaecorum]|uniref:ParB/RepB/Spo0J family partition protein n=1 Tax=Butyricicoccus pullicaecorum TaxID=501571 RepID=UPI00399068B9
MAMRKGLGKGLGALIGDYNEQPDAPSGCVTLPLQKSNRIRFSRANPSTRKSWAPGGFHPDARHYPAADGTQAAVRFYQIIAGERRWRAARLAGLTDVPVVVIEADDKGDGAVLIENLQRSDLNPIEEALAIRS